MMNHPYIAWPIYDTVETVINTKLERDLVAIGFRKVAEICAICSWKRSHPDHSGQGTTAR